MDWILMSENSAFSDNQIKSYISSCNAIIEKNSVILILCACTISDVIAYRLSLQNNSVVILYNGNIKLPKIIDLIERFKVNYVWASSETSKKLVEKNFKNICFSFSEFFLHKISQEITYRGTTSLILLSTSGTIGCPKLVMLDYENIYNNSLSIIKALNLTSNTISIFKLPIYNAFGLSIVNSMIFANGKLIIPNYNFFEKSFWDFSISSHANFFYGVPYSYKLIQQFGLYEKMWNSIESCAVAGGHLNHSIATKYATDAIRQNKYFYIMYGQTEATARMSCICNTDIITHPNSVGKAIDGGKFAIKNSEIHYYGKNVFKGYANDYKDFNNTRTTIELNTHDTGYLDGENYLYVLGRSDRLVKFLGNRIQLETLEISLSNYFRNYTFAVIFYNSIFYIFTDYNIKKDVINYIVKESIIPRNFVNVQTNYHIPLLPNNKINYSELRMCCQNEK